MKTKYMTPDVAVKAREQLNLSQAKVAAETGISRSYLSQFEVGRRVLEDSQLEILWDYFESNGWTPNPSLQTQPVQEQLTSSNHGLSIKDGFVVASGASDHYLLEDLLGELYSNNQEIDLLLDKEFERGLFGIFIEEEARKASIYPLMLMARQCEIVRILHGKTDGWIAPLQSNPTPEVNGSKIKTVGDYIRALIGVNLKKRTMPVSNEL